MAITTQVATVGTASTVIVPATVDAQSIWLESMEPSNTLGDFSRHGNTYITSQYLTIANGGTALFSFITGDTGAQFDYWQFDAENSSVRAQLIEGATITTTGTVIPAYNMNRNSADTYDAVLETASALTGGTVVLSEYVGASNQASGGATSSKVITLEPNTEYGFKFVDVGGNGTPFHAQIAWVEKFNGWNDVWLEGSVNGTVRLRGGEKVQLQLLQGEGLSATAARDGVQVAVMRQD